MRAIVIGATGATGKELTRQLLDDPRISAVVVLTRRPFFPSGEKLREVVVDFEQLPAYADEIHGDVAFSCLGTTRREAGGTTAQWRVDHDYQLTFAKLCRQKGINHFVLLSSAGAGENSLFFYSRMKGTLENAVKALGFPSLTIIQPGPILRPQSTRKGEVAAARLLVLLNRVGLFPDYRPISTSTLARAIIQACHQNAGGITIYTPKDLNNLPASAGHR